jgi:cell division protein FtsB
MDPEATPAAEVDRPAAEPYPPPPSAPPTSWQTERPQSPARRFPWRTVAVGVGFLVAVTGMGLLYFDDTANQATIRSLTTQNESLTGRNQILTDQLKQTQTNLTATLGELADTKAALAHPHLTIWNVPQDLKDSTWLLAGGIPDTFTYHLVATSTGPMSVSILTFDEWAKAVECIDYSGSTANYCMHHSGTVMSWLSVTSVNYDFHLSEGCADYLSVFTSAAAVTVTPNVSVTYNPASSSTGACV